VTSILVSGGRRFARVDGRIVGPGDRLGSWIVKSIDSEAVIVADASGRTRRIEMERRGIPAATR
jgi:hypothetical protein